MTQWPKTSVWCTCMQWSTRMCPVWMALNVFLPGKQYCLDQNSLAGIFTFGSAVVLISCIAAICGEKRFQIQYHAIHWTLLRRNVQMQSHLTTDAVINTGGWDKHRPVTSIGAMEAAIRTSSSAWGQTKTTVIHSISTIANYTESSLSTSHGLRKDSSHKMLQFWDLLYSISSLLYLSFSQ